jgi:YVTN family beta-propeller protein
MQTTRRIRVLLLAFSFFITPVSTIAQEVIATAHVGGDPAVVAVNPAANKIYVANYCGNDPTCSTHYGTVTIIDGKTFTTKTVAVGIAPIAVAVNSATNKIYVVNQCGDDPTCKSFPNQTVTVIDGTTLSTSSLSTGFALNNYQPNIVAVNPVTNKIYVIASCGNDPTCQGNGAVTVIDGATNIIVATITVGSDPDAVEVNRLTNEVYVANACGNDPTCRSNGTVTVIDGANNMIIPPAVNVGVFPVALAINEVTNQVYVVNSSSNNATVIDANHMNQTTTVPVGSNPLAASVNPVTNLTYVVNESSNNVTVIDGQNNTTNVNVGNQPFDVGVDEVTNKVYVTNLAGDLGNTVTVIDGATNSTVTVTVGYGPTSIAVNSVANRIYVGNQCGNDPSCNTFNGTVSVIAGANSTALQFVALTPCRLVDTRNSGGPIQGGTSQAFNLPQLAQAIGCANLSSAGAYSLNVTLVPVNGAPVGYLTIWPTGEDQPLVSTMNSLDGRTKANAAIVPAGYQGAVSVYVTDTTNVVLDIDGYFAPVSGSTLAFYPLTPCRVLDTRNPNGGLGGPHLSGGVPRDFPVLSSTCNIPSSAQAYSFNFTAVPYPAYGDPLGYLELWPKDQMPQHPVSTLNNTTGTIVANAAIVPAGTAGEITAYASNDTDLVADITGYFALGGGGISLYSAAPCRVLDTRKSGGAFSGELNPPIDVVDSSCGVPSTAESYVFSVTVIPQGGPLGFLTLWPDGQNQPLASTLNAADGAITSNMAILQNFDGESDAYANGLTQLLIDVSSYFAP